MRGVACLCLGLLLAPAGAAAARAQSPDNVAVVVNDTSATSRRIGEYYARVRGIPPNNVIHIRAAADEIIERDAYVATIEEPVANALRRGALQDRILYIVLTKGVPLRISGTAGLEGTGAGVDSELTLLYRRTTGRFVPLLGRVDNPYYLSTSPIRGARPFSHRDYDIYLVSRLDGFTEDEAVALVDRAQKPSQEGRVVLDERAAVGGSTGDAWLAEAAKRLGDLGQGQRVLLEETSAPARDVDGVLGYYSWGSTDPANRVRRFKMQFVPGALASTFVSTDARTFRNPPESWTPTGDSTERKTWFGGSPQSLAGDLIREGATGVSGQVAEPYLQSTVRPEILFPAYLAGFNLIEAFYLAIPHLSWQTVVVGDPLCAPFPRKPLTPSEIEAPVEAETGLPGFFFKRRLENARSMARDVPQKALSLQLLAEVLVARGDAQGARAALEQATVIAPELIPAQLQLAAFYEEAGQISAALSRYRQVLAIQPNNAGVLNNLAYGLAVGQKNAPEALPFARKAVALEPANPTILDTLGWIEHLLGHDAEAARIMTEAVRRDSGTAAIHLHAAAVFAAAGALAAADAQVEKALSLDPSLRTRRDVIELRARLKK